MGESFGIIRSERPPVRQLTLDAACDSDITYKQLARVISVLKKQFPGDCKITRHGDIHEVFSKRFSEPLKKGMFEEYVQAGINGNSNGQQRNRKGNSSGSQIKVKQKPNETK